MEAPTETATETAAERGSRTRQQNVATERGNRTAATIYVYSPSIQFNQIGV
jgi:hypothetical protein